MVAIPSVKQWHQIIVTDKSNWHPVHNSIIYIYISNPSISSAIFFVQINLLFLPVAVERMCRSRGGRCDVTDFRHFSRRITYIWIWIRLWRSPTWGMYANPTREGVGAHMSCLSAQRVIVYCVTSTYTLLKYLMWDKQRILDTVVVACGRVKHAKTTGDRRITHTMVWIFFVPLEWSGISPRKVQSSEGHRKPDGRRAPIWALPTGTLPEDTTCIYTLARDFRLLCVRVRVTVGLTDFSWEPTVCQPSPIFHFRRR